MPLFEGLKSNGHQSLGAILEFVEQPLVRILVIHG
jgi:hypothetical protein